VLTVAVNGVPVAEFFDGQTLWCDPAAGQAVIPAATFNSLVDGGDAVIDIASTGGACPFATLTMDITYESDCNANAIPDDCDIAGGYAFDIDNNFIPDECEGGPIPGDCDQNDVVDLLDHTCFYDCLSGPGIAADSDCFIFDHDIDSDVDLDDFAAISTILSSGTE
jgi:hypothetical protein